MRQDNSEGLVLALIDGLDANSLERLAERLRPYLPVQAEPDGWLDINGAAAYLALPRSTLHKLTAARSIPFSQDCQGGKLYFKRSALDAWRES